MSAGNMKLINPDEDLGDLLKCPICQDVCDQPRILSCQHIVCEECINNWIKTKKGQLWCPECNQRRELPDGGAEYLPHSFRLNDITRILREKSELQEKQFNCKLHPGQELDMICYECETTVCVSCSRGNHAGHLCADAKQIIILATERREEQARSSLCRIDQLQQELEKGKQDGLDIMKDFKKRFDFAYRHLLQEVETIYQEKVKTLKSQQLDLESIGEDMKSIGQMTQSQESIDVNVALDQLKSFPTEVTLRPKTTSLLKVKMNEQFVKMLFSDGETKCGLVVTSGVPDPQKSVVEIVSKEIIAGQPIELRLVLKDAKGREVLTERSQVLSVEVSTVDKQTVSLEAQKVEGGHFQVSYTPSYAGCYVIKAWAYKSEIDGSPMQVKVRPRGREMKRICGSVPFVQPHDVLKIGDNFVVVDKCVFMIDKSGELVNSFVNNDWYFYPYSVAMHAQFFYITAMKGQVVIKYNANGKEIERFGVDVLKKPTGIALDKEGNIFVADSQLSKILLFHPDGKFHDYVNSIDGSGHAMKLNSPWFIKFNNNGDLVIADFENNRIQVLNIKTRKEIISFFVKYQGRPMKCRGVDVDRHDNIYVAAREDISNSPCECILVYSPDGTFIDSFNPEERLHWMRGVHIDKRGQRDILYVVDADSKSIRCFEL